jgi:hypothetical protein
MIMGPLVGTGCLIDLLFLCLEVTTLRFWGFVLTTGALVALTLYLGKKIMAWQTGFGVLFIIFGCLTAFIAGGLVGSWVAKKLYEANLSDRDELF